MRYFSMKLAILSIVYVSHLSCLNWSAVDLPCPSTSDSECEEGYSCLSQQCVPKRSIAKGSTCTRSIQCENESLACVHKKGVGNLCLQKCNTTDSSDCLSGEKCESSTDTDDVGGKFCI